VDRNSTSVIDIIAESQNTSEYIHIVAWASMCKSTDEDSEGACPHSHQPPYESPPRQFRNLIQALVGPGNSFLVRDDGRVFEVGEASMQLEVPRMECEKTSGRRALRGLKDEGADEARDGHQSGKII